MRKAGLLVAAVAWVLASPSIRGAEEVKAITLKEARELALRRHPRITAAELIALASREGTREAQAAYFPQVFANLTAVGTSQENTRIGAGALNNPAIFDRFSAGVTVSMLITDFGRRMNLADSSKFRELAEEKGADATREQVLLELYSTYFSTLQAQSLVGVAQQTVETRRLLAEQVTALANNKLKSDLDVSFARVSQQEGELLLARAQNDLKAAFARLSTLLGFRDSQSLQLVDEPMPEESKEDLNQLIAEALEGRPDLARLQYQYKAADTYAQAEGKLNLPTISAVGTAGLIPVGDSAFDDEYAAAGVNVSIPLFTGFNYSARRAEADLRAKAAAEVLRDEENLIARDVRIAWQNVAYARQRIALTNQLAEQATLALDLTQTRYNLGTSSIVDLSQAQLNKTSADIAKTNARYDYQIQRALLDFQIGAMK